MARVRIALGPFAATWLLCQLGGIAIAPVALWLSTPLLLLECTCPHGDHATCPMHRKPAPDSRICLMRGIDDTNAVVVRSAFGAIGPLPARARITPPASDRLVVDAGISLFPDCRIPPDSPPPRA